MTLGDLPVALLGALAAITGVVVAIAWRDAGTRWTLAPYRRADGELRWRLGQERGRPAARRRTWSKCRLVPGGHRLSTHVILRFVDGTDRRRDVTVWRGAVSAQDFSRLHALLAWRQEPLEPCATLGRPARHGPHP